MQDFSRATIFLTLFYPLLHRFFPSTLFSFGVVLHYRLYPTIEPRGPPIGSIKLHYSFDNTTLVASLNLLIHLFSNNRINPNIVKSGLRIAWRPEGKITFNNMALTTFLVNFSVKENKIKVMEKDPWFVKGNHVILKEWNSYIPFENVIFNETFFWIQAHSLPPKCINLKNVEAMGNVASRFLGTDLSSNPIRKWKKFLRIRVSINVQHDVHVVSSKKRIRMKKCGFPLNMNDGLNFVISVGS